jgi:hypothetical protein
VRSQVHVIDQEHSPWSKRGVRLAELEDLPARSIGKDRVERADRSDEIGSVSLDDRDPVGQAHTSCLLCNCRIELHAEYFHIVPGSGAVDDKARPTPHLVPIFRIPPPMGAALTKQDMNIPTSGAEKNWEPDWSARVCAALTASGSSTTGSVDAVGRGVHAPLTFHNRSPTSLR